MGSIVLAYDLGGTKVEVGVVNEKGEVLDVCREPVVIDQGKEAVIRQLGDLGNRYLSTHPEIEQVGVASAGPLDPIEGVLLDPTNFTSKEGSWGKVPLGSLLSERLQKPVYLENDAAAAMLAEHWIGAARDHKNAMILTLGTGLGTGVVCNGELLRAGRNLHTEAGHMIIDYNASDAACGCGNTGCAEAFLSGRNFSRRNRKRFGDDPTIGAKEMADLARKGDARALLAFEEYAEMMATALHNYVMMFCPEIFVFTGSFAAASDLFLDSARDLLEARLIRRREGVDLMPKLVLSELSNHAGLIGAARVAFVRR